MMGQAMTLNEEIRYKYFINKVGTLASKYKLTVQQTVYILDNIREFNLMFSFAEFHKFISFYKTQESINGN
jgi:hypothetical protein